MTIEDEIAAQLSETRSAPRAQIARIIARCGEALTNTILQETLVREGSGDVMTKDGTQRHIPCGAYFELVRQRVDANDWFFITHGRARGEGKRDDMPMSWTDRIAAAQEAKCHLSL